MIRAELPVQHVVVQELCKRCLELQALCNSGSKEGQTSAAKVSFIDYLISTARNSKLL